jgi:hypothetical protein
VSIDAAHLSHETREYFARNRRRLKFRRVRQNSLFVILLAVGIWGFLTHRADNQTFAWDDRVSVAFIALLDQAEGQDDVEAVRFVELFMSRSSLDPDNLRAVEKWIQEELTRHTGNPRDMFEFSIRGPVRLSSPPPNLPQPNDSFWSRMSKTSDFMGYFEDLVERDDLMLAPYDVTIFIYFYDIYDSNRRAMFRNFDSLANQRTRVGVVFAPIVSDLRGNTCAVIAHELCHTLGAGDKYVEDLSVFPEGYVEPNREPRSPQPFAEIMALGRPVASGKDEYITDLDTCRVGDISAAEMNWQPS